jgi:hypothetical protein
MVVVEIVAAEVVVVMLLAMMALGVLSTSRVLLTFSLLQAGLSQSILLIASSVMVVIVVATVVGESSSFLLNAVGVFVVGGVDSVGGVEFSVGADIVGGNSVGVRIGVVFYFVQVLVLLLGCSY